MLKFKIHKVQKIKVMKRNKDQKYFIWDNRFTKINCNNQQKKYWYLYFMGLNIVIPNLLYLNEFNNTFLAANII
jgi:hypothetical protein